MSLSYQICRTKLKVSSLNLISTTLLLIFLIIILFQLIYYLNFYPRISGKIISYILFFGFFICLIINKSLIQNLNIRFEKKLIFVYLFLFLYFLLALSAVTDIDSLDYHLGAPLGNGIEIRHFNPDMIGFIIRGASLGEILNLFGLHFGSDNFGQLIQFLDY